MRNGFHSRGYLPHLKVEGAAYFVTFRLADSLPRETVLRLKERRADLVHRTNLETSSDQNDIRSRLLAWYSAEVDSALDRHCGAAWLRRPEIAAIVATALRHFEADRYALHAWCIMPNHVHAVVQPHAANTLESILHSWKSYTANRANQSLGKTGESFWQTESYDHWIRDGMDFAHCCRYTEDNPVAAGLVAQAADWHWSSAAQ